MERNGSVATQSEADTSSARQGARHRCDCPLAGNGWVIAAEERHGRRTGNVRSFRERDGDPEGSVLEAAARIALEEEVRVHLVRMDGAVRVVASPARSWIVSHLQL